MFRKSFEQTSIKRTSYFKNLVRFLTHFMCADENLKITKHGLVRLKSIPEQKNTQDYFCISCLHDNYIKQKMIGSLTDLLIKITIYLWQIHQLDFTVHLLIAYPLERPDSRSVTI